MRGLKASRHASLNLGLSRRIPLWAAGVLFLAGILFFHEGAWAKEARSYEARGTVVWRHHGYSDEVVFENEAKFVAQVEGERWVIRSFPKANHDDRQIAYDGTLLYSVESLRRVIEERRTQGLPVNSTNVAMGSVSKTALPNYHGMMELSALWLAYASATYFDNHPDNLVEPPTTMWTAAGQTYETLHHQLKRVATIQRAADQLSLPKLFVWMEPGNTLIIQKWGTQPYRHPPPYDRGFTNLVYSVAQTTNYHGNMLPAVASMKIHGTKREGQHGADLRLQSSFDIRLESAGPLAASLVIPPRLPGVTYVGDRRFVNDSPPKGWVGYLARTNFPTEQEVRNSPAYRGAPPLAQARPKAGLSGLVLATAPVILPLAVLLPGLYWLRRRKFRGTALPTTLATE